MIDKNDQEAYIRYLEERLEKLTKNSSIGDQDLNTLIDTENEVIINNSYSFKKALSENELLLKQIDELQKRNDMSDEFIQYLMDSFGGNLLNLFALSLDTLKTCVRILRSISLRQRKLKTKSKLLSMPRVATII